MAAELRTNIFYNYTDLPTPKARGVVCDIVNQDLCLCVHDLVRFAHQARREVVPPPRGTVFDTPPVPAFQYTLAFCQGDAEILQIIGDVTHGQRSGRDGTNQCMSGVPNSGPFSRSTIRTRRKRAQVCTPFACAAQC